MEIFIIIFILVCLLLIFPIQVRTKKKQLSKILEKFSAEISMLGLVSFRFKKRDFRITYVGTQSFSTGLGGSYPVLELRTNTPLNLLLAPVEAKKYHFVFALPDSAIQFQISQKHFFLYSKKTIDLQKIQRSICHDGPLSANLVEWFDKKFSSLSFIVKYEIESFRLKKVAYLKFTGLNNDYANRPEVLQKYCDSMLEFENFILRNR